MEVIKPANEVERVETLRKLSLLDTASEERFDRITRVAQRIFGAQMSLINLIDAEREWTKSASNPEFALKSTPRQDTVCTDTILQPDMLVIPDMSKDERYKDNPSVVNAPHFRAYAGVPVSAADGTKPATLCVLDDKPRAFSEEEKQILRDLGTWVEIEINFSNLQQALDERKKAESELEKRMEEAKVLNDMAIERELKMVELKKKIGELEAKVATPSA